MTVSFSEKVSAAQFKLSFDTSKFENPTVSAGTYNPSTNTYVYLNYQDIADLGSVTFSFKAKAVGTGSFHISGIVLSSNTATLGTSSTSVTVEKAKAPSQNNSGNKKPNNNQTQQPEQEPEVVTKIELEMIKAELAEKIETDYTQESLKALQEIIARAEAATTNEEYNAIKGELTLDKLVIANFDRPELFNILIELIGKSQKDYTEDSWQELQEAIQTAQNAKLKSEYDEVKDKLTLDTLKSKEGVKQFFINFIQRLEKGEPLYLAFVGCLLVLLVIILILLIVLCKRRKSRRETTARRLK